MDDDLFEEPSPTDTLRLHALQPKLRVVWHIEGLLVTLTLGLVSANLEYFWLSDVERWPLPDGALTLGATLATLMLALVLPPLHYQAWSYALRDHDVVVHHGILWKVSRSVPRSRIQHVDIQSGPLERAFGLVRLTLYTAGTEMGDATIPGLAAREADAIREVLLSNDQPICPA